MSEAEQAGAEGKPSAEAQDAKKNEPSLKDVLSQLDEVRKAQSGSDRKVKELNDALTAARNENDELKKERMTEKQRSEYELEQVRKRNEQIAHDLATRELALERATIINEMSIPKDLAPFVAGKDGNEIRVNAASLMKYIGEQVLKGVNERLATSGETPRTGNEPAPQAGDKTGWEKAWAMKPGPEKDAAIAKLFETLKGQQIGT